MRIYVRSFGVIKEVDYEVAKFSLFIGEQASGKSTLSKLVYYFLHIRDEVNEFILDSLRDQIRFNSLRVNLDKRLKKRFVEFFGPSVYGDDLSIVFKYSEKFEISLSVNKIDHKYIDFKISEPLYGVVIEIVRSNSAKFSKNYSRVKLFSNASMSYVGIEIEKIQREITSRLNEMFGYEYELLFIPASRSILSVLSDQLQNIHPHLLDFPMRKFIEKVTSTKAFFLSDIEQIIKDKEMFELGKLWYPKINKAKKIVDKILKGRYVYDESGGKIVFSDKKYVKMSYASSGQQESIWIVLSLFLAVLDRVDAMVFIEEPEAHLFPVAQKNMVDLIVFVANILSSRFYITTHSPYILSAINNCLYAGKLKKDKCEISSVFDIDMTLNVGDISVCMYENGCLKNIVDSELGLIDIAKIDECSKTINDEYSELEKLEFAK